MSTMSSVRHTTLFGRRLGVIAARSESLCKLEKAHQEANASSRPRIGKDLHAKGRLI